MLIKAGSTLVVPRAPHVQADVSDHLADNGSLALAPCVARANQGQECRAYNGWNSEQCLHQRWDFWFEFG